MRDTFSRLLVDKARSDNKIILLTGDHGYALFDKFREEIPDQFINAGVAEQNMVGVAAGLSRAGFKPIIYGLSSFIPVRVLEQVKIDLAHDNIPAVIIGDGAGFVYSYLGTSHQSTEDISLTRSIPNLKVFSPCDRFELEFCLNEAFKFSSTVYLRMGKSDVGEVHNKLIASSIGMPIKIGSGKEKISFIATGSMCKTALDLKLKFFPEINVYTIPVLKPINKSEIINIAKHSNKIVTFEEHSIYGGLGSLVSEICIENHPVKTLLIGVNDRFSKYCGSYQYLLREHQLDMENLKVKIENFLKL